MAEKRRTSWRRIINRRFLFYSAIIGMMIVYASVVLLEDEYARIFAVTAGLIILELGVWYAASPFLTSERRYHGLREELDHFIKLVRELNTVVVDQAGPDERARVKASMQQSLERMDELAGVEGPPSSGA